MNARSSQSSQSSAHLDMKDDVLLMALLDEDYSNKMAGWWFLDSGCSNHMSGDQTWFLDMDTTVTSSVKLGNGTKLDVAGKGSIRLLVGQLSLIIQDVFYVPKLQTNLLSIGQLQEKNLSFVLRKNICQIFHEQRGMLLETTMKTNRMFVLHAEYKDGKQSSKQ